MVAAKASLCERLSYGLQKKQKNSGGREQSMRWGKCVDNVKLVVFLLLKGRVRE